MMQHARVAFLAACLVLLAAAVHGQSNEMIDKILQERELTYGSASYLVLAAIGHVTEDVAAREAVRQLEAVGWGISERRPADALTLGEYAYLLMQAFEFRGGLLYRLAPGPRYAAREIAALRIAEGHALVGMTLSGERALRLLGRAMAYAEGERL